MAHWCTILVVFLSLLLNTCHSYEQFNTSRCFSNNRDITCLFLSPLGTNTRGNPCTHEYIPPTATRRILQGPAPKPTSSPTRNPTPSPSPTSNPTPSPTINPTAPTTNPSSSPSPAPTTNPTNAPIMNPTRSPTPSPTQNPTKTPTKPPTNAPTLNPTLSPTPAPTIYPTFDPTADPTVDPTSAPTTPPTITPTNAPTHSPSIAPSNAPSIAPSIAPTQSPSIAPTSPPTNAPTLHPSHTPTLAPTFSPTLTPSVSPTSPPTLSPTQSPSLSPSFSPSITPTNAPTNAPSMAPTNAPSTAPTIAPTTPPSIAPSDAPSTAPSIAPSFAPSLAPSLSPTMAPTNVPSVAPSMAPTNAPSFAPTPAPSRIPTPAPSMGPTNAPSISPSGSPSQPPTISPSVAPSDAPSFSPSLGPSVAPTYSPSDAPSDAPSLAPSIAPSLAPSMAPSDAPSIAPSIAPTYSPSDAPSFSPSLAPSDAPSIAPSQPPTTSPSLAPSAMPSMAPSIAPTQPPSVAPSSSPSTSPTYTSCSSLEYALRAAQDGDAILMANGVYNISYGVDIIGMNNIIIVGYRDDEESSVLLFDFASHIIAMQNRSSFINIINSSNITFQHLKFVGQNMVSDKWSNSSTREHNIYDLDALFYIENSPGIEFDDISFEWFNISNAINISDANDEYASLDDMVDGFALINIHHIYNYFVNEAPVHAVTVKFAECIFKNNDITNGLLVKSIAYSLNNTDTYTLKPIILSFVDSQVENTYIYNDGGLIFAYNTILHIDNCNITDNEIIVTEEHDVDEHTYPYCIICLLFDDDEILYEYISGQIAGTQFTAMIISSVFTNNRHQLSGGMLLIHSSVDTDSVVLLQNNTFYGNYVGINGGVIHFTSYSSNTYFQDTTYCDMNLCGTKLSVVGCQFEFNRVLIDILYDYSDDTIGGGVLFIDIEHNYSSTEIFRGHIVHSNEVEIVDSVFKHNTVNISNTSTPFNGGIVYFNYNYIHSIKAADNTYRSTWNILQVTNSQFSDSNVYGNGGAICVNYNKKQTKVYHDTTAKHIIITDCLFSNNTAINGSAIKMDELSWIFVEIQRSDFINNSGNMGTISIDAADAASIDITDCTFIENQARIGSGIYLNIIPSNDSSNNAAQSMHRRRNLLSAIHNNTTSNITATPTLPPTQFITTTTTNIVPTAAPTPTTAPTAAPTFILFIEQCPQISIANSTFHLNSARFGAGIYVQQYAKLKCLKLSHYNTTFTNNIAEQGAAFYLNRIDAIIPYAVQPNSTIVSFDTVQFHNNTALNGSGGSIYIDTQVVDISCSQISSFNITFSNSAVDNSSAAIYGGGAFIKCAEVVVTNSTISGNRITFNTPNKGSECSTTQCLKTFADTFENAFGGRGAGIYLDSVSMVIVNNTFADNSINIGNGGGLFHIVSENNSYSQQNDIKMIIKDNNITGNSANWNLTMSHMTECTDYAGLAGFAGGFWLQIMEQYNIDNVQVTGNKFVNNTGVFVTHLYYDVYSRDALETLQKLALQDNTNTYSNNTDNEYEWSQYERGTSPINFTDPLLIDGGLTSEECDINTDPRGCIGYVLPGDDTLFRVSFQLKDYFGQTSSPFLSCSHFLYNLSPDLAMHELTLHSQEHFISVEFGISEAEYLLIEYINISDTHRLLSSNIKTEVDASYYLSSFHVITTLCSAGQEVSISTDRDEPICKNADMAGVSFKCGRKCGQNEYLFTRWEPICHSCPLSGAKCSGDNIVSIDYANYAKITNGTAPIDESNPEIGDVCTMEFNTYLCPAQLCCTNIGGCRFYGANTEDVCARNRDAAVNFCGKCMDGFSELVGSYQCDKCDKNNLVLLLLPIGACFMLEIYLILRNPFIVTPLFTFVYKSLLYFYQILPILTYESYLSLVMGFVNVFDLSVLTSFGGYSGGTCLFANMTAYGKLWVNFIIPLILVIELLILRIIPEVIEWRKSRKSLTHQLKLNDDKKYSSFNEHEQEYELSYDPTRHQSIYSRFGGVGDSMDAGLLANDTLEDGDQEQTEKAQGTKQYELIRKHLKKQEKFNLTARLREHYGDAFNNTLLIMYIVVCESSIKMFNCAKIDNQSYLWYAGDRKCYDASNYIFMFIFVILLSFPFWIVYQLWKLRGSLAGYRRIKFAAFTMSYRRKCWYYEAVMMCRRIILISVYAFPKTNQYLLRAIIAFFCGGILAIHVKVQPFRYKINNHLETVLLTLLFLVSALSTVADTTGLNLKYPTSVIALIPLLFLPYLSYRYCRDGVVPKVKNIVVRSKTFASPSRDRGDTDDGQYYLGPNDDVSERQTDDYDEYIAPQLESKKKKMDIVDTYDIKQSHKSFLEHSMTDDCDHDVHRKRMSRKYSSEYYEGSNDSNEDMYDDTALKSNQEYLVIGNDGGIELALFDSQKKKLKQEGHKKKSWYNNIFGRERAVSEQYQSAGKQKEITSEKFERKGSGLISNIGATLNKKKERGSSTVSELGDYDLSVNLTHKNNENEDSVVTDLFLSPRAKRKKAAGKLQKKEEIEQREMAELVNSSGMTVNKNDSIEIIYQFDNIDDEPKYNSIGSHTIFLGGGDIDDEEESPSITTSINVSDIDDIEPTNIVNENK